MIDFDKIYLKVTASNGWSVDRNLIDHVKISIKR